MTATEIINEIDKLNATELEKVRDHLREIELSAEELVIVEERAQNFEANPKTSIPWEQARARLANQFK